MNKKEGEHIIEELKQKILQLEKENTELIQAYSKTEPDTEELLSLESSIPKLYLKNSPFFKHLADGAAILRYDKEATKEFIFVEINAAFEEIFRQKREDIIGTRISFIFEEESQIIINNLNRVIKGKKPKTFEVQLRKADKHLRITAINLEDGFLTTVFSDMSKLRRAEDKILFERNLFQTLLDKFPDAIYFKDREARFIRASLSMTQLFNTTPNEIIGKTDFDFFVKDIAELKFKDDMSIIESGLPIINKEEVDLTNYGKRRWVSTTKLPLFDKNGKIIGIFGISRDITERKEVEEKEVLYKNNLQVLSKTAIEFLEVPDKEKIFHFICKRLTEHLGDCLVISGIISEKHSFEFHECHHEENLQLKYLVNLINQQAIAGNILSEEIKELIKTGNLTQLKSGIIDLISNEGQHAVLKQISEHLEIEKCYLIGLVQNSTFLGMIIIMMKRGKQIEDSHFIETFIHQASIAIHRKILETELIMAKEKAEESDRLKSSFLANLSHEIRTPVTGIQGFGELLQTEDLAPEKQREYIEIINHKSAQLVHIISDIIDISKLESNQVEITPYATPLNMILEKLRSYFEDKIIETGRRNLTINFSRKVNDNQSLVYADSDRIKQILSNLINNAIKFTKDGNIEYGFNIVDKDTLKFFVYDTGIGVPEEMREVIFDRFRQIDESNTRRYGGTGLGLAIAKNLVLLMGGKIWVENAFIHNFEFKDLMNPGLLEKNNENDPVGSAFYFTIPYNPVELEETDFEEEPAQEREAIPEWSDKTFFIVEDDEINYEFIKETLNLTNANIIRAEDGEKALQLFEEHEHKIDAILMDIQLPLMNGYEVTEKIREKNKIVPIIAQTAYALNEDLEKSRLSGCTDYISKPYTMDMIIQKIKAYV